MQRREFLGAAAASALTALTAARTASAQMGGMHGGGMGGMAGLARSSQLSWATGLPLRRLPVLANASPVPGEFAAALVASRYLATVVPGHTTELWGYNHSSPGPLIELREGQDVAFAFDNQLDLDSTIHWHGLAVPADQDGSPMDPVRPRAGRFYAFEVPSGSAGTYWYHPHAHQTVSLQVGHGLAAPLVVRSADDPLQALPELTLMITSLALDRNAQVAVGSAAMPGMGGTMMAGGGELLVNGQRRPVYAATPGATERWRIINATADRYLRLGFDGHVFAVVGTDGGLLGQPLPGSTEWLLAPAQRVEIVVTIGTQPSARHVLRDLGYGGGMMGSAGGEIMTVATNGAPALPPVALPATLRPVDDPGPASVRQQVVLSTSGMGMMSGRFLINGRSFDMNRVDLVSTVGRVELWDLVNTTFMDHPIHIHGTQFQVVGRTVRGVAAPVGVAAWLDTVNVPAGETVTIKIRQAMPGKRLFHCHILPHEDAGMMAVLGVSAAA